MEEEKIIRKGDHAILRKEFRPERGKDYVISLGGQPAYKARVVEYSGGCWAKVEFQEAVSATLPQDPIFTKGSTFDIKVAHYGFEEAEKSLLPTA